MIHSTCSLDSLVEGDILDISQDRDEVLIWK